MYAFTTSKETRVLWHNLYNFVRGNEALWLVCGDFNCLLEARDKLNGNPVRDYDTRELRLDEKTVIFLGEWRFFLPFSDRHIVETRICCKLDLILVNDGFYSEFPNVFGFFTGSGISCHC